MLSSGYYSDDLITSALRGRMELEQSDLWAEIRRTTVEWARYSGRLFPAGNGFILSVSYFLSDLLVHKTFVFSILMVDLFLFGRVLESLTNDKSAALMGVTVVPLLFQFRLYHDPILSFAGFVPAFFGLVLLSMWAFTVNLKYSNKSALFISFIAFNIALYMYEVALPLVLIFPLLAWSNIDSQSKWVALRKTWPLLAAAAIALVLNIIARIMKEPGPHGYTGTTLNLEWIPVVKTFIKQMVGAFPLSYRAFDPSGLFRQTTIDYMAPDVAILFVGSALTLWLLFRRLSFTPTTALCLIGGVIFLAPATLIAISKKYQGELELGLGYVPVYIQYFGLVIIFICFMGWLAQRRDRRLERFVSLPLCLSLALCSALNFQSNQIVIAKANVDCHYRRAAIVSALKGGILNDVATGATIEIRDLYSYDPWPTVRSPVRQWAEGGYPWLSPALVRQFTGRQFQVVSASRVDSLKTAQTPAVSAASNDRYILTILSHPEVMREPTGFVELTISERGTRDHMIGPERLLRRIDDSSRGQFVGAD